MRVRVRKVLKGDGRPGVRTVVPKDPGGFVYFDQEFDQAKVGDRGTFYVGWEKQPDLLMGFRRMNPDKRAPRK